MPIQFPCPGCGKILAVSEENAGKHARCPACELVSLIPESSTVNPTPHEEQAGTTPSNPFETTSQPVHVPINSHLIDAILATIFCCFPFGIVGIVFAAKCKSQIELGNYALAQEYSEKAQFWNMVALVLGICAWMFLLASFNCGPGG